MTTTPPIASESGHWYAKDGTPVYQVQRADGKGLRDATLRDARKLNLVPGVSTIIRLRAQPGLVNWMIEQSILAALTLPQNPGESATDFAKRVRADGGAQAAKAAEEGTRIHKAVELALCGMEFDQTYAKHVRGALMAIEPYSDGEPWSSEMSFASEHGYGGKMDLHNSRVIMDFKGKDLAPDEKPFLSDDHAMQLDAYRNGIEAPQLQMVSLYISRSHPGVTYVHEWEDGNYFERFLLLLRLWQLEKNFDSSFVTEVA